MRVQWKTQRYTTKRKRYDWRDYVCLPAGSVREYKQALLVRSVRKDGKACQEVVARLGSFSTARLQEGDTTGFRVRWWQRAEIVLATNVPDQATRDKLIAQLDRVIPRPTEEENTILTEPSLPQRRLAEMFPDPL